MRPGPEGVPRRYQVRSTILTSQLPVSRWHEQIGDPTLADGILDRFVHNAHRIEMRGDSMRKSRGKAKFIGEVLPGGHSFRLARYAFPGNVKRSPFAVGP